MIGIFDIVKFILSFLVISIHVEPLASINPNIDFLINNSICRIAVPIFFSIAGFLFYNKITNKKSDYKLYFKKYIKRIIIMYLFWSLVYFIPYFYQNPSTGRLIKFIPHLLIHGVYSQLWYLLSLIEAIFLFYYLNKKKGLKFTFVFSLILYCIGLVLVPYYNLIGKEIETLPIIGGIVRIIIDKLGVKVLGRNGLLFGLFFFTLGAYLTKSKKMDRIKVNLGIIVSLILIIAETFLIKSVGGQYYGLQVSLILITYFSMRYMIQFDNSRLEKINTKFYRSMSILIYLIHEWIHFLYEIIVPENSIFSNSLISYFVICMISILLSYSFYKLSNTKRFSILKKVY